MNIKTIRQSISFNKFLSVMNFILNFLSIFIGNLMIENVFLVMNKYLIRIFLCFWIFFKEIFRSHKIMKFCFNKIMKSFFLILWKNYSIIQGFSFFHICFQNVQGTWEMIINIIIYEYFIAFRMFGGSVFQRRGRLGKIVGMVTLFYFFKCKGVLFFFTNYLIFSKTWPCWNSGGSHDHVLSINILRWCDSTHL